jgi:hypothetical protein
LTEFIRNKIIALTHLKWITHFGWVKGHAGIEGNELVKRLAKEAAVQYRPAVYDKIPRRALKRDRRKMDFIYGNSRRRIRGRGQ